MADNTNEELRNKQPEEPSEPKSTFNTTEADVETLHELIVGVNNIFDKTYTFKEIGKTFRIQVKFPSFIEKGRINAEREDMLVGTGKYQPESIVLIYQTMATLSVCGIDVPSYFSKEASPREDILYKIGIDIDNWIYSFR